MSPHATELLFHTPVPANKMELFGIYGSTMRNAPYIHPSHDSVLELWRTFPNAWGPENVLFSHQSIPDLPWGPIASKVDQYLSF